MEVPEFTIRRLDGEADARLYREIRLESLRRSPEAYGSDFDSENARPLEFFAGRLANSYVLGGFRGETLAGVAGFAIGRVSRSPTKVSSGASMCGRRRAPSASRAA